MWNAKLETGVEHLDAQHKELVSKLDKIKVLITQSKKGVDVESTLNSILDDIQSYVVTHFKEEENYMEEHGLLSEAHLDQHEDLLEQFSTLTAHDPAVNMPVFLTKLYAFLLDWLTGHIMKSDIEAYSINKQVS